MTDDLDLTGKTALVTGSGRNIGKAVLLELARRGADVIVNARSNREEAQGVADEAAELGVRSHVVLGDVSDPDVVAKIAEEVDSEFGGLDIYVSNAARRLHKSFFEITNDEWHRHLNMQLSASWYLAKAFIPGMKDRGWGRVIHINGPDGWYGGWLRIPHSAGKGGLRSLTKGLAREVGPYGITVNDVVPGVVKTIRDPVTHPQVTEEFEAEMAAKIPIRRLLKVEDLAWACLMLCSDRGSGITGAAIHVDGGDRMIG